MSLAIVHRDRADGPLPVDVPVWRTCLREIHFFDTLDCPGGDGRWLVEDEAYSLLLEVVSGLCSPLVGETQVLGQFKAFLAGLDSEHAWLGRVGQRVLADARDIRAKHLQGLGSRSYGSAVRRYLTGCVRVALIGTGKLADELLPFLFDEAQAVDQWGRTAERPAMAQRCSTYRILGQPLTATPTDEPTVLIVAAPVAASAIEDVAAGYRALRAVIDLRAEADGSPARIAAPLITLRDVFEQMRESQQVTARQMDAVRADIEYYSRRFALRDELRPFGWDDLCA